MSVSRRRFFQSVTLSFLGSVGVPSLLSQVSVRFGGTLRDAPLPPDNQIAFGGLTQLTLQRLVGESFAVSADGSSFGPITLIAVSALATPKPVLQRIPLVGRVPGPSSQKITGFTARFEGLAEALPQGTYTLTNQSLGSIPLLLVPSQPGLSVTTYTAVFSFLV